jgi:hypothetical protein
MNTFFVLELLNLVVNRFLREIDLHIEIMPETAILARPYYRKIRYSAVLAKSDLLQKRQRKRPHWYEAFYFQFLILFRRFQAPLQKP